MLVQPDHPSSSVKLRRKNRHSEFADTHAEVKRRNRYSGGEFLVGSPVSRGHVNQQPPSQVEAMRKSGDWSYVSFPASSKSPPVTPKMTSKRPLSLMQNHLHHQPISLLETKVMASIIHNNSRERHEASSKSAHCTPVAMQKLQKSSDLDYSSLGSEAKSRYENHRNLEEQNPEEYTKLLRRRMISEVLQKPPNNDIWQLQQQQQQSNNSELGNSRSSRNQRETKRRPGQRRSHSAQGRRSETQSEVNSVKPSKPLTPTKPGLGRRSATQLEISRRKRVEEESPAMQKAKWHSQENLDTVLSPPLRNGNFAGGRRELALRLLSNGQEEEPDQHLDATDDDDEEEISKNRFANAQPQSLISGLNMDPQNPKNGNLKKGILWQQRDKIFARWKERFFVLTKDYLQCFKKGSSRITEMGGFIYGIRLSEIVEVALLDKRGYLTICLTLAAKDGKLFLRKPEGIRDWYQTLKTSTQACKERRSMQSTEEFWSRKQFDSRDNSGGGNNIEQWLIARQRIGMKYNYANSPACSSPSTTWERENNEPKSMPDPEIRRCRTPKSAPNSRPQSSTRSTSRQRRSLSQHPNPSNMGVEHVYESPKNEVGVTSPSNSARSSRLSNGFFRDSGNDTMYTSSGGSTDSSNREQLKNHANSQRPAPPQRRYSEAAKRISASNLDNFSPSASSTPKKSPYHRHLPSQATRV